GASADGATYALAREAEDVAAVVRHAGADALLLGHSFGAVLALEAANLVKLDKLLVYEPYAPLEPAASPSPATQSLQSMVGDAEALLERFLRHVLRMGDEDVERLRAGPTWQARVAAAHTIPREMAAVECHHLRVDGLVAHQTRVRFLLGEQSPPFLREATM